MKASRLCLACALAFASVAKAADNHACELSPAGRSLRQIYDELVTKESLLDARPAPGIRVIDMHAHTFNSTYIPVEQVARVRGGEFLNLARLNKIHTWGWLGFNAVRFAGQALPISQWIGQPEGTQSLAMMTNMLVAATERTAGQHDVWKRKFVDEGHILHWLADIAEAAGIKDFELSPAGVRQLADHLVIQEGKKFASPESRKKRIIQRTEQLLKGELEARVYLGARILFDSPNWKEQSRRELSTYIHLRDTFQQPLFGAHHVATTWSADVRGLLNLADFLTAEEGSGGEPEPPTCGVPPAKPDRRPMIPGANRSGLSYVAKGEPSPYRTSYSSIESLAWFLLHISQSWQQLPKDLLLQEQSSIDLAISQMMAMTYPLNEVHCITDDGTQKGKPIRIEPNPESIPGIAATHQESYVQQCKNFDACRKESGGRSAYFVAWNPFVSKLDPRKASWAKGLPRNSSDYPAALKEIHEAVTQHGAWGVKFYPPMGYRPAGNATVVGKDYLPSPKADPSPWADTVKWYERKPKHDAWDNRYKDWEPQDLDNLNDMLFQYCLAKKLPIFAHCNTGEMLASAGYARFANPCYWRLVLEKHPDLRLCLGHAGGHDYWFRNEPAAKPWNDFMKSKAPGQDTVDGYAWGQEVIKLCCLYPNVYCEVGIHSEICDPSPAATFTMKLSREIQLHPAGKDSTSRYDFGKKVMYGTDWYMPIPESPYRFLNGYLHAFDTKELRAHKRDFFANNAAAFLRLSERLDSKGDNNTPITRNLPAKASAHLRQLASDTAR